MIYLTETNVEEVIDGVKGLPIKDIPAERLNSKILAHVNANIDSAIRDGQKRARKLEMKRRRDIYKKKIPTEGGLWDKISYLLEYIDTFF